MRNKKPALPFIFITILIDSISFGIIIPVFPSLIMQMENCDLTRADVINTFLTSTFALTQFLFSPLMGNLSDRFGRRPILLASLFGFGLDYLLLAFAPSVGWLYIGRIIAGMMGASYTTATAYIADISTEENRAKNFGMVGAAFGLGFIIGPGIGGILGEWDTKAPFIAGAILSMLNWLYGYFILPESLLPENRRAFDWKRANPIGALRQVGKYKNIIPLLVCFFLLYLAATAVMTQWSFYTIHKFAWGEKEVGISIMVVGILVAVVQGLLVRVVNPKIGNFNAVIIGLFLYIVGMFGFAFASTGFLMLVAILPYCLGGINGPAMQTIMSESVPANSQGELQGIITSSQSITMIFGPVMMGGIFNYFGAEDATYYFPGAPFVVGALLIFIALVIAYYSVDHKFRIRRPANESTPGEEIKA